MGFRLYDYLKTLTIDELATLLVISVTVLIVILVTLIVLDFIKSKTHRKER